jgi:hypothetical protein
MINKYRNLVIFIIIFSLLMIENFQNHFFENFEFWVLVKFRP